MNFSKMSVGSRLALGFGLLISLLLIISLAAVMAMRAMKNEMNDLTNEVIPNLLDSGAWQISLLNSARHSRNMLILDDQKLIKGEIEAFNAESKGRGELIDSLNKRVTNKEGKAALANLVEMRQKNNDVGKKFVALVDAQDMSGAKNVLLSELRPIQLAYLKGIEAFLASQKAIAAEQTAQAHDSYQHALMLKLVLVGIALLLGGAMGVLIGRSVTRQLGGEPAYAATVAQTIADGDLSDRVMVKAGDQSSMLYSMAQMRDSLSRVVGEVHQAVESVNTAAGEIAQGNSDLSHRTESQASALEQTAASLQELTTSVKNSADTARAANQVAAASSAAASKGGAVVQRVVQTMSDIEASSQRIADITSVINGISFQTNILALNAAVEAARAGEQGRGFAVVASEVRSLAQRSAEAAKEIQSLISDSVEKVGTGTALVAEAGEAMQEIVVQVGRVSDLIGEISATSSEQTTAINEINQAVTQLDEMTQQNAALVEEGAAAAESLKGQAQQLSSTVSVFRLR